jgi:hypothetical protein
MFDQPRGLREITGSEPSTMPQYMFTASGGASGSRMDDTKVTGVRWVGHRGL